MDEESFQQRVDHFFSTYRTELVFLVISFCICVISGGIYFLSSKSLAGEHKDTLPAHNSSKQYAPANIQVDISGAVKNPDVYSVAIGTRLKDILTRAGGLADTAAISFFYRNYNLARYVTDQEKIYVPSIEEIQNSLFTERQRIVDYTSPSVQQSDEYINDDSTTIHINPQRLTNSIHYRELGKQPLKK